MTPFLVKKIRVEEIIEELRIDPHNRRPKVDIKLISSKKEGVYRVRIGKYRMVYQVDEENMVIYLTMIFHREKGYIGLDPKHM